MIRMTNMNQFLLCLLVLVAITKAIPHHKALRTEWDKWKKLHGRSYDSKAEESKRLRAYVKNSIFIANHNLEASSGKHSYFLKMNQFGDMLHNEFLAKVVGQGQSTAKFMKNANMSNIVLSPKHKTLPRELDWRSKGAVTPVKNQGDYRSDNYFAAIGNIEGSYFLKTGELISMSVQQMVDCDTQVSPPPGQPDWSNAMMSIYEMGGLESEEDYPYHGKRSQQCYFDDSRIVVYVEDGYYLCFGEPTVAAVMTQHGPLAIKMNAAPRSFQFYSHGVYSDRKCREEYLNHGALVIGFGVTNDDEKFWTVKNSWGTSWGEDGYIRIAKDRGNMCGVASLVGFIQGCSGTT